MLYSYVMTLGGGGTSPIPPGIHAAGVHVHCTIHNRVVYQTQRVSVKLTNRSAKVSQ